MMRAGDYQHRLEVLLAAYHITLIQVDNNAPIPGSYWGEPEAGLIGTRVFFRADTPVHSVLHEACHVICMPPFRRSALHTDAGGATDEEDAVCYLQILLADTLGIQRKSLMEDMDHWGYSFRLGSAREWFENDAEDARRWLAERGLIDSDHQPIPALRMAS